MKKRFFTKETYIVVWIETKNFKLPQNSNKIYNITHKYTLHSETFLNSFDKIYIYIKIYIYK